MDSIFGTSFRDATGLIAMMADQAIENRSNAYLGDWKINKDLAVYSGNLAGIPLKLRYDVKNKKTISISGSNYNWLLSFSLSSRRKDGQEYFARDINLPVIKPRQQILGCSPYFHSPCVLSPEGFQKEMTILMLFCSEWNGG